MERGGITSGYTGSRSVEWAKRRRKMEVENGIGRRRKTGMIWGSGDQKHHIRVWNGMATVEEVA
jgi:hypothetical protein